MKIVVASCLALFGLLTACRSVAPVPSAAPAVPPVQIADPDLVVPAEYVCAEVGAPVADDVERICVPLRGEFRGAARAVVNIVIFSDFECPFCARVLPTLERLRSEGDDVRLYFHQAPLPFHPNAVPAALASLAAGRQGKFWPLHDWLFAHQRTLDEASLLEFVRALPLNADQFNADRESPALLEALAADEKLAAALAVRGTPHFFINGRRVRGAQPYEVFQAIVEDERTRVGKLLSAGVPRGRIYAALMGGQGKGLGKAAEAGSDGEPR